MAMKWGRSADARNVSSAKCSKRLHAFTWITVRNLLLIDETATPVTTRNFGLLLDAIFFAN